MKKIIFGLALATALLCGCQKINDLESRVKTNESDIAALKSDLAKLQAAVDGNYAISSINTISGGYVLNLTNGSSITLKNGADGAQGPQGPQGEPGTPGRDGDAYFSSVEESGGVLIVTLIDGSVYRIPLAEDYPLLAVKSLTYIPVYEDGMATVSYFKPEDATVAMDFMIKPAGAAKALMSAMDAQTLKAVPVVTYPKTRSLSDLVKELSCISYEMGEDGLFSVTVDASGLDDSFFSGKSGAAVALVISDGVSEIASDFVALAKECTGLEYQGVVYHVAKMADGKTWMAENLRYVPEGYTPSSSLTDVTAGVFMPVVVNADKTAAVFGTAEDAEVQGYLYQSEVALGLKVGDITSVEQAEALEGTRGICPEGWHIPTIDDITGLVGKAVSPVVTNTEAPYYNGSNGSIKLLNADGFNLAACGAVSILDNTRTSGTFMGKLGKYDYISSGYICGSTYAGNTIKEDVLTNVQFFGLMPMTNKDSEDDYTCNGSKLSYRIAASVRCVKD